MDRGDKIKILWHSQDGLCIFMKRLSDGKFQWPQAREGSVSLSAAQLSMLLEERNASQAKDVQLREKQRQIDHLKLQLARFRRWKFGQSSEGLEGAGQLPSEAPQAVPRTLREHR